MLINACAAVGPDYKPPQTITSDAWKSGLTGGLTDRQVDPKAMSEWWGALNDPVLSGLIEKAVSNNPGLKEARARLREARARRAIAMADLFPTLDGTGSVTTRRSSEQTGTGRTLDLYQVGFDAGWELDLFGGVRRSVEAAEADLTATREELGDVLISLLAEVAINYLDVRSFQTRLLVAISNLKVREETCNLAGWRYQAGLATGLDVEQATYSLEATRAEVPSLKTGLEQAKNGLSVLLGDAPGSLARELQEDGPIPVADLEVAVGVPAEVLRRRPDVRRAERELAAQTARIGVATADLYPKFSLTGSIGLESLSSQFLFDARSRTYGGGPSITWPIFKAGAILNNIEVQSALQEQKLMQYRAAVLAALEDVENAMTAYAREQERRESLGKAVQSARAAVELSQAQYASGLIDFQVVLEAQRALLLLEDQLALSNRAVTADLISLYKALGGGWTSLASNVGVTYGDKK